MIMSESPVEPDSVPEARPDDDPEVLPVSDPDSSPAAIPVEPSVVNRDADGLPEDRE